MRPALDSEAVTAAERVGAARALVHVSRLVERAAEAASITLTQYRLLSYIENTEHRAGQLAELAALSRPALTLAVDGLEQRGLVSRERVEADRRAVALRLTRQGRKVLKGADAAVGELLDSLVPDDEDLRASVVGLLTLAEGMRRLGQG